MENNLKPTFNRTVNILVQAYLNDELKHQQCEHCAVGNICRAAGAPSIMKSKSGITGEDYSCGSWFFVFGTPTGESQRIDEFYYHGIPKKVIDDTGYTWQQLARIEYAFESALKGENDDDWMFNGLMAVVDVLADIHNVDLSVREDAKLLFAKP